MRTLVRLRIIAAALLMLLATCSMAFAQATRTWVSGVGDDANPCSRTAPCKTFAGAISKTAVGGEIDVLDPGGFGALTITKSISIEADGLIAGVLVSGTNGFIVSAPGAVVMIRGITFEGLGTGVDGIQVLNAAQVYVENCQINNFTGWGIDFKPGAAPSALFVKNTTVRHNGNFGLNTGGGITISPSPAASVSATLNTVRIEENDHGLFVQDGGQVAVQDSVVAGNSFAGLNVTATTVAAGLFLDHVVAASNGKDGAVAGGNALSNLRLANSTFTGNGFVNPPGYGVNQAGGNVISFGNNNIGGNNTMETNGTITASPAPH